MFKVAASDFKPSRRLYAVRPESMTVAFAGNSTDMDLFRIEAEAAWFRRKSGETAACIGTLWDFQAERPWNVESFLRRHEDGRYGASCRSRFTGHNFWTSADLSAADPDREFLKAMLAAYPAIPLVSTGGGRSSLPRKDNVMSAAIKPPPGKPDRLPRISSLAGSIQALCRFHGKRRLEVLADLLALAEPDLRRSVEALRAEYEEAQS